MKPRMFYRESLGLWCAHSVLPVSKGNTCVSKCPFVAYMRWMEKSIKAGEQ